VRALRERATYANVMSTMAVFIALGGAAYAVSKLPKDSVGAKQIAKNAVRSSEIKAGAVKTGEVRDGSLLGADFASGQLPAGARGATGPTGPHGATGAAGAPGTARAYGLVSTTAPFLAATRSKNVASVTNPSAGTYCVTLDASIDATKVAPIVTPNFSNDDTDGGPPASSDDQSFVEARSDSTGCPTGTLSFETGFSEMGAPAEGNTNQNEGFFFAIP